MSTHRHCCVLRTFVGPYAMCLLYSMRLPWTLRIVIGSRWGLHAIVFESLQLCSHLSSSHFSSSSSCCSSRLSTSFSRCPSTSYLSLSPPPCYLARPPPCHLACPPCHLACPPCCLAPPCVASLPPARIVVGAPHLTVVLAVIVALVVVAVAPYPLSLLPLPSLLLSLSVSSSPSSSLLLSLSSLWLSLAHLSSLGALRCCWA